MIITRQPQKTNKIASLASICCHIITSSFPSTIKEYYTCMDCCWTTLLVLLLPPMLFWALLNLKRRHFRTGRRRWAFFHPFCNDGGGGEKVLWCMVKALADGTKDDIAIYSLEADQAAIVAKVQARFGITIDSDRFTIVPVGGRWLLTSKNVLTMALHLILPPIYAVACLWKYQPDIFYDTTGFASTLITAKLLLPGCQTAAYVHYPFISEEMLEKVRSGRADFNNSAAISRSPLLSKGKLVYYQLLLKTYCLLGRGVDFAQTNSSWTHGHVSKLWPHLLPNRLVKLYPPCTVNSLLALPKPAPKTLTIMSLAQFRPEKQQLLQLQVFSQLLKEPLKRPLKLRICGTTRGADDEAILSDLRKRAAELNIEKDVEFVVNQPFSTILACLQDSWLGLHTMEAEHFGISVVEMLAAGLLVVAHNSAGPKMDIIGEPRFLAEKKEDYAGKLLAILQLDDRQLQVQSDLNRKKATRFGEQEFSSQFLSCLPSNKQE